MPETKQNQKTTFSQIYSRNVQEKTEKKGDLTYLSWAWAWAEFKKFYPQARYKIRKFGEKKLPYVYDEKTGYMVFTEVEVDELKYEMWLPVMDYKNQAMKENATMFDINKTLMRCLAKNLAMFGLGLYIYAGEDLPEQEKQEQFNQQKNKIKKEAIKKINQVEESKYLDQMANWASKNLKDEDLQEINDAIEKKYKEINQ